MTTESLEIRRTILRLLRAHEEVYAAILYEAVLAARRRYHLPTTGHAAPRFDRREDYVQVLRGIGQLIEPSLAEDATNFRRDFFETSAEGLAEAGIPPFPYLPHVVAAWQAGVVADMTARLPEGDRPAASAWFMSFFAEYMSDIIDVSLRFSKNWMRAN